MNLIATLQAILDTMTGVAAVKAENAKLKATLAEAEEIAQRIADAAGITV